MKDQEEGIQEYKEFVTEVVSEYTQPSTKCLYRWTTFVNDLCRNRNLFFVAVLIHLVVGQLDELIMPESQAAH